MEVRLGGWVDGVAGGRWEHGLWTQASCGCRALVFCRAGEPYRLQPVARARACRVRAECALRECSACVVRAVAMQRSRRQRRTARELQLTTTSPG